MKLPLVKHDAKIVERVLCGADGIYGAGETIRAENIELARLPAVTPCKPRTCFAGITGEILQFFSSGDRVCVITRTGEDYSAQLWDRENARFLSLSLAAPRADAFLYAHAWRGARLYLPAFSAVLDVDAGSVFYTDRPLVSGEARFEYDEAMVAKNCHVVYFLEGELAQYTPGEYVMVEYARLDESVLRNLFLRIVSIDEASGAITLEGEGAPDLINSEPGTITLRYDIPALVGVFADHERLYGFEQNRIHVSAKGESGICFTRLKAHDVGHAAVTIELDAEVTGGCMYKGSPFFFTDGAVVRLVADAELGFRVLVIPTVGVTPQAVTSPAVVGNNICYFSRHGLALFDGKQGRVVRAGLSAPQGGAAVADGRFYSFFAAEGDKEALYAYDAAKDLLYSLGADRRIDVAFALGGVLIGTERASDGSTRLLVFAERENLPYPISAMVESGVLTEVSAESVESVLELGEERFLQEEMSPFALFMDAELDEDATLCLELYCDGADEPIHRFSLAGTHPRTTHRFACYPRRCQSYRVRVNGKGNFRVFDIRSRRYA